MKNKIFHTQDPCLHTNSRCAKNSSRMEIIMELLEIAKKRHSVRMILSILVYTFFTRMFDFMLPLVVKYSIVAA